ncbi:J domain-containing protein [Chitinimonas koreensis]|uniref:J domain-containing protein n=1 Tax=Chitinimonas koreensis TaxID=356302 RepID=UPI0003F67F6F|nr:DnaJ domain-containing protein [Chitinimonas koreensis]QNM96552.1 DnaJ domain-containing protein [Chitinimonas koreensis]
MTRPSGKTLYALLGVAPDASQTQLDAAYKALSAQLSNMTDERAARDRQQQLDEAYQQLSNPLRRSVYDASLQAGQARLVELAATGGGARGRESHDGGGHSRMLLIGLGVLTVFVVAYVYFNWRQARMMDSYREVAEAAQRRAIEAQGEVEERAAAYERAAAEGESGGLDVDLDAKARQAKYEAERAAERRERENREWNDKIAYEQRQAQSQAEREERDKERARQRAAEDANRQQEQERRNATERVERERRELMEKLLREKRFGEARELVKNEYELERIKNAERYAR